MNVEYVALQYSPDRKSSDGRPVAVVYRYFDADAEQFYIRHHADWRSGIPSGDLEYIEEVLSDFSEPQGTLREELFQRLGEMSSGVLRTATTGVCSKNDMLYPLE